MQYTTQPKALRAITTAVTASEAEAPVFRVFTGQAQWDKDQVSFIPGFDAFPFVRVRVNGVGGQAGDVLAIRGKLPNGTIITLATVTAGTGGVFPAITDVGDRLEVSYGVRVTLAGATPAALNNVTVYIESFMEPKT
jgi:hypothetical protein